MFWFFIQIIDHLPKRIYVNLIIIWYLVNAAVQGFFEFMKNLDIEGCYLNTFNGEVGQKSEVEEVWKYQVGLTILHPFFESNLILPSQ